MSLLDTFVQVFEFDTRQADAAFKNVQRSTDDIIDGMKQAERAAEQSSGELSGAMNELWQSLQTLTGEHPVNFSTNAADVSEQTGMVKVRLDAVTDSLSALRGEQEDADAEWQEAQASLTGYEEGCQALVQAVGALSNDVAVLTDEESRGNAVRHLASAMIKALQGDYKELIRIVEEAREKGIGAGESEVNIQKKIQNELDKTKGKYQKTGEYVVSFARKGLAAVGLFMGASALVSETVSRATEIVSLDKLGKKINVATADVDAFAGSVAGLGGARESAQADLSAMAKAFGGTTDSMEKILATADKVQGMTFDKAKAHLASLGVTDDKTIELMMKGRHEMERMMGLQKEYSGITKESIEQSRRFNLAMQEFRQSSGLLKNSFLEMVLPYLAKGMEWLGKFVSFCRENKNLIIGFFLAIGVAVAAYYIPPMLAAAAATLAATWPILAMIAIIAALAAAFALVYDDIMNFIDGNDSMIGRILDAYPELKQVIMTLWEAFKTLFEYLKIAAKFVADVVVDAYNTMNNALNQFIGWLLDSIKSLVKWGAQFGGVFDNVADSVVGIFTWMWEQVQKVIGWISGGLDTIQKGWSKVKGWFGADDDDEKELTVERKISAEGEVTHRIPEAERPSPRQDTQNMVEQGKAQIAAANNHPLNPVTSQAISNRSSVKNETILNIGEVKVETKATDAKGMAAGTKGALQEQLQDLGQQTQTGLAI